MIRINFVRLALFLLLTLGFISLVVNEVQAWHYWHDSFYTHHHSQQPPLIFDIASGNPLPTTGQIHPLPGATPLTAQRTVW